MNPELLDRSVEAHRSYSVTDFNDRHFIDVWHYHEQVEIVAVLKGRGMRFVGDSIERFKLGQIVILGGNLPHMWKNDREYFASDSQLRVHAVTIHLGNSFLTSGLSRLPELTTIQRLLAAGRRGVLIRKNEDILEKMRALPTVQGVDRFLALIEILHLLGSQQSYQLLASEGFVMNAGNTEGRLKKVHRYVMNSFREGVELEEAARLVHMNPSAFSRFFSSTYRKPFIRYVNDIRIGYARKLLIESQLNITDICFESGFRNVSNFNRQFKKLNDMTPTEFRKRYEQK